MASQSAGGVKMRFYTYQECDEWSRGRARKGPEYLPPSLPDVAPDLVRKVVRIPDDAHVLHHFASAVVVEMCAVSQDEILFWATDWSSLSPWHLYFRLRQSYGDFRLLDEAPGHLFLPHENEDLASFLSIAMANYWDGYLLPRINHVRAVLKDVFIDFYADDKQTLEFVDELKKKWPEASSTVPEELRNEP
jgi:hypothetical protein